MKRIVIALLLCTSALSAQDAGSVSDSFYGDNDDPDADLEVSIAKVPSRIAFSVNSETINGTGNGALQMIGAGSFDIDRHAVTAAGTLRCTQTVQLGPVGCAGGQGMRWTATNLLNSLFFRCTTSSTEAFKQAVTGVNAVALLADLFPRGDGAEPALALPMIVASVDIAPDISGTQNVWIGGIGCGSAAVNFNAD